MFSRSRKKVAGGESGFTLIEIMTAVTILAIMATVAFTIVFGAVKRSRHIDQRVGLNIETASILNLMLEDLRGAYASGNILFFRGEDGFNDDEPADSFSLLTTSVLPVNPEVPAGGVGEVEYSITQGEKGLFLLLRREENPARDPFDEGGQGLEITDRIRSLNVEYSDGEEWFQEWDTEGISDHEAGKLPRQVRIEIVLKEGDLTITHHGSVAPVMAVGR